MPSEPSASRPRLVLWGTGGHALVVAEIVRMEGVFEIVGAIADSGEGDVRELGLPLLGTADQLDRLRRDGIKHLLIAFGDCEARLQRAEQAAGLGFGFPIAVHPSAVISRSAKLGPGPVASAGAIVNPGARIGSHAILNTGSLVDHECVIGDGAHICPGAQLAGRVTVGRAAWLGIGSVVRENLSIGDRTVVGAGAVVVGSLPADVVAYGCPARVARAKEKKR